MRSNPFETFDVFTPIRTAIIDYARPVLDDLPAPTLRLLGFGCEDRKVSLTDSQHPEEQLRFFQSERVYRFLRHLATRFKDSVPIYRTPLIHGTPEALSSPPVRYFLSELERLGVRYKTGPGRTSERHRLKPIEFPTPAWLTERFSVGDTWSTLAVIEKYPDVLPEAEVARLRGIGYALQGRTDEAELELDRWRRLGTPANQAWALYSIAMLYARHHRTEKRSLHSAEAALNEAYRILSSLDESTPDLGFYRVFNRNGLALIHFRRGAVELARDLLRTCIAAVSNTADHLRLHRSVLIYNLAQCETSLGNLHEAKEAYSELLTLDPDYAENRIEFANLLIEKDEKVAALIEVDRAISLDPSVAAAWAIRARLMISMGDPFEVIHDYERAMELAPEDLSIRIELAEYYLRLAQITSVEKVLSELPESKWASAPIETQEDRYVIRAEIALTVDGAESAMALLRKGLARLPHSTILQENLDDVARYA